MLSSRRIAATVIFAALDAVLNLIPVSRLLGTGGFLTIGEILSPLPGMVLGPLAGGIAVLAGTFLTVAIGKPLAFDGLDFIPAVAAAVTAGFAMTGRVTWSLMLSLALFAIFAADPLSPAVIAVGAVPVPYLWMHMLSVIVLLVVVVFVGGRTMRIQSEAFIAAVLFISTMNAHVSGRIMFEDVLVRTSATTISPAALQRIWNFDFSAYPVERAFSLLVGSIVAIPVLRAMPEQTLRALRGEKSAGL